VKAINATHYADSVENFINESNEGAANGWRRGRPLTFVHKRKHGMKFFACRFLRVETACVLCLTTWLTYPVPLNFNQKRTHHSLFKWCVRRNTFIKCSSSSYLTDSKSPGIQLFSNHGSSGP
jgi:hypothetical protein